MVLFFVHILFMVNRAFQHNASKAVAKLAQLGKINELGYFCLV